jgi:hypothetical protein
MAAVRRFPFLCVALVAMAGAAATAACSSPHSQQPAMETVLGDGGGETVLLPDPDGGVVAWDGWAGEFITDYCVSCHSPSASCFASGCHTPGDPRTPDFRQKAYIVANSPMIRCGIAVTQQPDWDCGATAPESFPLPNAGDPIPTDEQRGLLVGWIDAGCP